MAEFQLKDEYEKEEEYVYSKLKRNELKIKEFKEYLASKDVLLSFVKFLLSLRNSKEKPDDPLLALKDYFGEIQDGTAWKEKEELENSIENFRNENNNLEQEIENLKIKIINTKEEIKKKQEEERIRLEEEQAKKDKKKPPIKK